MTPQWESRKTPPEGGRKSMRGERQDIDLPVAEKNANERMGAEGHIRLRADACTSSKELYEIHKM